MEIKVFASRLLINIVYVICDGAHKVIWRLKCFKTSC